MDKNEIQNLITQGIKNYMNSAQYGVTKIPSHLHNGKDTPKITVVDLPTGTPLRLGLGGMISTSNKDFVAPNTVGEQIVTSIVAGKDQAGSVGITTENLQFNLIHYPQNASDPLQSFVTAFRPPLYETIFNTTISVTAGGNTLTTVGYGFDTNILAKGLINIYDSTGALVETQTIVSNTSTVITISGTWLASTTGTFRIWSPVYLGEAGTPWRRLYVMDGTAGGIRFGVGTTNGGQNGLLYMDSGGALNWRNNAGLSSAIGSINARSYGSGVTTINDITNTKLTLATNDFANGVTWDSGNNRLTILTAGQYLIIGSVAYNNTTADKQYIVEVYKNGSVLIQSDAQSAFTGNYLSITTTDIQTLAANDYLELYTYQQSGVSQTIDANTKFTYLSIAKV